MLLKESIKPREYQKTIAETASNKSCLVVLPTGLGKTLISVLVTANRLEKYPESKAMVLSPTRPLCAQIQKVFRNALNIDPEKIILITGKIKPKDREELYKKSKIIVSTPQCIELDLKSNKISLTDFSIITFDESHRSVGDYSYTFVAKKYKEQSKYPLILGLTASPGGSYEKIEEIRKNLFIEAVEIRTEVDKDVKAYVKPIAREWVYVDFPEQFQMIKGLLEECLKESVYWLKEHNFIQTYKPSKKELLLLQQKIGSKYMQGAKNYSLIWAMIRLAEAVKIEHAIELLETQGISSLFEYLKKLEASKKRTDKKLMKDPRIREVVKITEDLQKKGIDHPKLEKLQEILKNLVQQKPDIKIIVFANYRYTVDKINQLLKDNGIKSEILIGQATKEKAGLTQEQQIEVLKRFAAGEFNVLVSTSIGEEGLSVPDVDYIIFYESVATEIRAIQRRGRTGRTSPGKVIYLISKNTRDEAYYWSAFHREKKMKGILYDMKEKMGKKKTLKDWI
jgi:Fanconi anemia group M protein